MEDPFYLLSKCIYHPQLCLILLTDGEFSKNPGKTSNFVNAEYFKSLDIVNNIKNNLNLYDVGSIFAVNATCHYNTMKSFKVQYSQLPTLILYDSNSETMYKYPHYDEFETSKLIDFVNKARNRQANSEQLKKTDIVVNRIKCFNVNTHKDKSKLFDYGGREFDEMDSDTSHSFEESNEEINLTTEFNERYNKILAEEKKKTDL